MSVIESHAKFCWAADVVIAPIIGLFFILGGVLMALLGKVTINGKPLSYAAEPERFTAVVAGTVAIGMLCVAYAVIRYIFMRRRHRREHSRPLDHVADRRGDAE